MAQISNGFSFTGRLGTVSAYKMKGVDGTILRTKGGASRSKIRSAPEFALTRRYNSEFSGRSIASKYIRMALRPLTQLADYNLAGPVNALVRPIQVMDSVSVVGERNICLTRNPKLLEGFNLNKRNIFDSIVRVTLSCELSRQTLQATIGIPALVPGINFFVPPPRHPYFGLMASLSVVPNLSFGNGSYQPMDNIQANNIHTVTDWHPVAKKLDMGSLELQLNDIPGSQEFVAILSIGIRFGTPGQNGEIEQVKNAGAAKILAVV